MADRDLVKTGISGLDSILLEGIPRGNLILLEGGIGTGKTTLGVEFVYRGASQFDEPGIIVLFEVSPDKIIRDAAQLGWDLPALQRPCDLELLMFFAQHGRTLMSSEQLARLLGYQLKEIAQSLDVLLGAGFLTRTQDLARPARRYVFAPGVANDESLPAIVEFASTREGRVALRRALPHRPAGGSDSVAMQAEEDAPAPSDSRGFLARRMPKTNQVPRSHRRPRRKW